MEEKKKIGIDVDDTVLDFLESFFSFYKKHHDPAFAYTRDEIENYLFEDILGVDSERIRELFTEFKKTNFFKNMPAVEGAKEGILELSKNHNITFITARPLDLNQETRFHLKSLFPKKDFKIIHSHDNENKRIKQKAEICKDLGITLMIEDDVGTSEECAREGITCFLIEKPWNRNHKKYKNIIRVKSWSEIIQKINEVEEDVKAKSK